MAIMLRQVIQIIETYLIDLAIPIGFLNKRVIIIYNNTIEFESRVLIKLFEPDTLST